MTAVAFHFNVPEPLHYACRLLRKGLRSQARMAVTAPSRRLIELDRMLWTFEPLEFVPHWRGVSIASLPAVLRRTPIVLLDEIVGGVDGFDVLVNLGDEVPPGHDAFARVIEVVSQDSDQRTAARSRWRAYASAGSSVEAHEVRA